MVDRSQVDRSGIPRVVCRFDAGLGCPKAFFGPFSLSREVGAGYSEKKYDIRPEPQFQSGKVKQQLPGGRSFFLPQQAPAANFPTHCAVVILLCRVQS